LSKSLKTRNPALQESGLLMHIELLYVQTADALRLDGVLIPANAGGTDYGVDCLLCVHGTGSNFYASAFFNGLTPHLLEAGLPLLRVNTRGHDLIATSAGKIHGSAYERVSDCVTDFQAWLQLLAERGYRRIGLLGHSLGALKGIFALSQHEWPAIVRLLAISPPWLSHDRFAAGRKSDLFRSTLSEAQAHVAAGRGEALMEVLFPLPYVVTASGYVDKYGPDERYHVPRLLKQLTTPTLVTFGTEELGEGGPFAGLPEEIERLKAAGEASADVRVIAGANHQYLGCHAELAGHVLRWLSNSASIAT
jgi:pimeloyl-ACP methyl ester carboxylesterase